MRIWRNGVGQQSLWDAPTGPACRKSSQTSSSVTSSSSPPQYTVASATHRDATARQQHAEHVKSHLAATNPDLGSMCRTRCNAPPTSPGDGSVQAAGTAVLPLSPHRHHRQTLARRSTAVPRNTQKTNGDPRRVFRSGARLSGRPLRCGSGSHRSAVVGASRTAAIKEGPTVWAESAPERERGVQAECDGQTYPGSAAPWSPLPSPTTPSWKLGCFESARSELDISKLYKDIRDA